MNLKDKIIEKFYGEPKPKEWDDDYDPLGNVSIADMKRLMDDYAIAIIKEAVEAEHSRWSAGHQCKGKIRAALNSVLKRVKSKSEAKQQTEKG